MQEMELLDYETRLVGTLTRSEKTKLSFLIAVLHQPPLIILDQPTSGVDPLIQKKMWKYLLEERKRGTSIMVSSSSLEEARYADLVGFMRSGYLLTEGPPKKLIKYTNTNTLQEAFDAVCEMDELNIIRLRASRLRQRRRKMTGMGTTTSRFQTKMGLTGQSRAKARPEDEEELYRHQGMTSLVDFSPPSMPRQRRLTVTPIKVQGLGMEVGPGGLIQADQDLNTATGTSELDMFTPPRRPAYSRSRRKDTLDEMGYGKDGTRAREEEEAWWSGQDKGREVAPLSAQSRVDSSLDLRRGRKDSVGTEDSYELRRDDSGAQPANLTDYLMEDQFSRLKMSKSYRKESMESIGSLADLPAIDSAIWDPVGPDWTQDTNTQGWAPRYVQVSAAIWRQVKAYRRQRWLLFFTIVLPILQLSVYLLALGGVPRHITLACVNNDPGYGNVNAGTLFQDFLEGDAVLQLIDYPDEVTALTDLKAGNFFGIVQIPYNFTGFLYARYVLHRYTPLTIKATSTYLTLDLTDNQISTYVQNVTETAYQAMLVDILTSFSIPSSIAQPRVVLNPPAYGVVNPSFQTFIA